MFIQSNDLIRQVLRTASKSALLSKLGWERQFLPKVIYPDDVYIVSYPKSGNTWVRFLLGNLLSGNQCDFGNIDKIVPEVVRNRRECDALPRPRFMKSHLSYTSRMPRAIYIVRDGRDVAVSLYFHLLKKRKLQQNVSFHEYLRQFNRGLVGPRSGTWNDHVLSWLDHWSASHLLVTYENLKRDTKAELTRILDFIGLMRAQDDISAAIEASDFKRMKTLEQRQSNVYHDFAGTDQSIPFMREGRAGGWRQHFSPEAEAEFMQCQGEALRRLNYIAA